MAKSVRKPLAVFSDSPDDIVLACYFGQPTPARELTKAYRALRVEKAESDFTRLQAAVATVLLQSVQRYLPQWTTIQNGQVIKTREIRRRRTTSRLRPTHLFTINFADTAPGISWPVAYCATIVPTHCQVVVTASADSPETYGWTDVAIGHFADDEDLLVGARRIIVDHWGTLAREGQRRWAYLFEDGLVDSPMAGAWADDVWSASTC